MMFIFKRKKKNSSSENTSNIKGQASKQIKPVDRHIDNNIKYIKEQIGMNSDMIIRQIPMQSDDASCIVYLESMINADSLNMHVIKPLSELSDEPGHEDVLKCLSVPQVEKVSDLDAAITDIFRGKVVLLLENSKYVYLIPLMNSEARSIAEPDAEKAIRGSREGFVERIDINMFLIRRKLSDPKLVIEEKVVGTRTNTRIAILYIKDITNDSILEEVRNRIEKIKTDSITGTGMIEQFIEDSPLSIFPQIQNTERSERAVQAILGGRICILCDGTPFVLMLPAVFPHFLAASEDYYERTILGSFSRFLRYVAVLITITLPSLYIALTSFHLELIPFSLVLPLAEARKEIPFPPLVEAFILEIAVEFLREMGVRLPQPIGSTLGVVGGIVLGEAAIRASLVSPAMVIVVGATAVISFTIPSFSMVLALRFLRFFMMIMAGMFGAYGITIGWIFILGHLMRLESFSIPYLSPFAPLRQDDLKDTVFRTFLWKIKYRPEFLHVKDKRRQNSNKIRGE